jgi:integrase
MAVLVRERPKNSGVYWVYTNHKGKRKAKKIGDKKLAYEAAKRINAKLTLNELGILSDKPQAPVFKEYADNWLETYVKPLRRISTYERYRDMLERHVYPVIGTMKVDEIKRSDVKNVLLLIHAKGLSKSTVCIASNAISGPLSNAVDEELLPANPVINVTRRLQLDRKKRIDIVPMTRQEIELFLSACRAYYPGYYPFFLCAFRTGMRLGELLALQWGDIDWNSRFINVQRSYKRGRMTGTKTGKTRRVDISDQLKDALQDLYTQRKREALSDGTGQVAEVVFHKNRKPLEQNSVRYIFNRILSHACLCKRRFHDICHSFASILLSEG